MESEEHHLLRKTIRDFVAKEVEPQASEFDKNERFNIDLFRKLGDLGLLGITVHEEFGGSGLDALAAVIAHEEISFSDPGFCLSYLAHSMLCVNNIAVNASTELSKKILPKLCSGEHIGSMGLSEPGVGTDVLGMSTKAEKKNSSFVLNGQKMWITNGTVDEGATPCDIVIVYARTGTKANGKAEISTFIVEKGAKGFFVGQKIHDKLGMRASNTAELCFENCEIPEANLVGELGGATIHMMRNLEIERLTLAAMSLGIAKRALQIMVQYANERKAFGKRIGDFGQIQRHIAESYAEYQAARSYVYLTASRMRLDKEGNRLDSDGVKLFATPVGKNIADRAIQVLGGNGYVGSFIVERLWRDAKLLEIGGGTLEAHQKNIATDLLRNPQVLND